MVFIFFSALQLVSLLSCSKQQVLLEPRSDDLIGRRVAGNHPQFGLSTPHQREGSLATACRFYACSRPHTADLLSGIGLRTSLRPQSRDSSSGPPRLSVLKENTEC
ncbi:hypothetical protein AVEN_35333-1 [Araneus ventricosus]|uniref:Secreted protein n=1 Tax=Araneus ventricosus TaxID=182803 RepID=A0A4Y2R2H4_ARAVE|nr:hypothetical protein AVEN_35333-1 [Araneus ventricosus]